MNRAACPLKSLVIGFDASEERESNMDDRTKTQLFELGNILISHCDEKLTPIVIDTILAEIKHSVTEGPCSWAFKG